MSFIIDKKIFERVELPKDLEDPELKGLKTDPAKGIITPSKKVVKDICEKEKFCKEQGPITFGQLRTIVEEAQKRNLTIELGEGVFKALLRLFPWFFPQAALAGFVGSSVRALSKILKPGIEETRGYKHWWGKTALKLMDLAEGEILPVDPIGKIFFISDGLLNIMDKKVKLKFARYIADLAASKPDTEPVPEFFVENELRNWLNKKFLLNPPLQPKTINESVGDDMDWIRETVPCTLISPCIGMKFTLEGDNHEIVYTIIEDNDEVYYLSWVSGVGIKESSYWGKSTYERQAYDGKVRIVNNDLNESEEDDLDWIREIPSEFIPVIETDIEIINIGDEDSFVDWLGDYSDDYLAGRYGKGNIKGMVSKVRESGYFSIEENNTGDQIVFPINGGKDRQEDYPGLNIKYSYIPDISESINESEGDDFKWLEDIKAVPNRNGVPQGTVYLYTSQEIEEFLNIILDYNGGMSPCRVGMSIQDCIEDYVEILDDWRFEVEDSGLNIRPAITVSFFVEDLREPNRLVTGWWSSEVDLELIEDWVSGWVNHDYIFGRDFEIYNNLDQVKSIFNNIEK